MLPLTADASSPTTLGEPLEGVIPRAAQVAGLHASPRRARTTAPHGAEGHDRRMSESAASAPVAKARHPVVVWVLLVGASLIAVVSILTVWVNRQLLDDSSWRKASADLLQDPKVRDALSVYLVDQLYTNVDVGGQLEQKLPSQVKPLAALAVIPFRLSL